LALASQLLDAKYLDIKRLAAACLLVKKLFVETMEA
jgi:hypothetical protein